MLRSTVKLISSVLVLRFIGVGFQLGLFMLLVRLLPIEEVGIYSAINAGWILMRALGPVGSDHALMRRLPQLLEAGRLAEAQQWQQVALRYCLVREVLLIIAAIGLCFVAEMAGLWSPSRDVIVITAGTALLYGLNGQQLFIMLASQRPLLANALETLWLPLALVILIGGLHQAEALSLTGLLFGQGLIMLGFCLFGLMIVRRILCGVPAEESALPLEAETRRDFARQSYALFATTALIHINIRLPVVIAPFFIGATQTALLETAMRFATLLGLMQFAAAQVTMPRISAYAQQGKRDALQTLLIEGSWLTFIPTLLGFALLAVFGKPLIGMIAEPTYIPAYIPMLVLAGGYVINASAGAMQHVFTMSGQARLITQISAVEMAVSLSLMLFLAHSYGALGIAMAVAAAMVLRNGLMQWMLPRRLELRPGVWSYQSTRWLVAELRR